jgi:MFS family permease
MSIKMIVNDRRFWPLFWTQFFGALNDNVFKNALVMMVTFQNVTVFGMDHAQIVALSGGLFILPFFLFSPLAGQISDKLEKSRLVRITKYWEIGIMALACVGFFLHHYELLLVVLFLAGVQAALFGPVKYSMIPDLVEPAELIEANAYVEMGTFLAILIGTIMGGLLVQTASAEYLISGALLFFALAGTVTALFVHPVRVAAPDLTIRYNPIPNFISLWQLISEKKAIFNSILGISWFWFFGAAVLSVLPVYCKDFLGVDQQVVTCFLAMFTIGIGVGSILCEKLSFGRVELGLVPIGSLGLTVFLLDLAFTGPTWTVSAEHLVGLKEFLSSQTGPRMAVDFFLMSMFGGFFILPLYTLIQERSHPDSRSRVIAANNILNAEVQLI